MERALDHGARDGETGFSTLYERHARQVFGTVYRLLGDYALSEDITQEVLLELWQIGDCYDPARGTRAAWVVTIARNRAIDHLRHLTTGRSRETAAARRDAPLPAAPDPAELVLDKLQRAALVQALRRLRPDQRQLLINAYVHGSSREDLARALGIPVGTVKSRIRLALAALRGYLP